LGVPFYPKIYPKKQSIFMPRIYEMSWEGSPNFRWVKMHKGVRHRVSCEELGVPKTRQESYQAANEWWRKQKGVAEKAVLHDETKELLKELERRASYAATHDPSLLPAIQAEQAEVLRENADDRPPLPNVAAINRNLEAAKLYGIEVPENLDPLVLQKYFGDQQVWNERFQQAGTTEKEKTLQHNQQAFLDQGKPNQRPATYAEIARYLQEVLESGRVWAEQTDVSAINETTVSNHLNWLSTKKLAPEQHNKRLGFFRRFIVWLWEQNQIDKIPRNLKVRAQRRKRIAREVEKFSNVAEVVKALSTPYNLWALLGLNCGMTPADLGALDWKHIDLKAKTLTRRRVKTGDNPKTPTVTYELWDETIQALNQIKGNKGLVFITKKGTPLVESRYDASSPLGVKQKNMFAVQWKRLSPRPSISLSKFRKIAATALRSSIQFSTYVDYFLAHAPRTVTERHYAAESDEPFFEALRFIRQVLFAPKKKAAKNRKSQPKGSRKKK